MIAYLDTNVYIGAKYQFSNENFNMLRSLIEDGEIQIIYSSATRGEVEQHIRDDVKDGVTKYNRVVRKELLPLVPIADFRLHEICEENAVQAVLEELSKFLALNGVTQIELNPLDAEQLMDDYFQGNPSFESKKPWEFKDAIMINAIRTYQQKTREKIIVVSNDDGFRKAFEEDSSFITVKYLSGLIKLCQERKEEYAAVEASIRCAIENNSLCELIQSHFAGYDIERWDYSEWECEEHKVDLIEAELLYIKYDDKKCQAYIEIKLNVIAEIKHRDEDTSYFDKEEYQYLFENYVTWREYHRVKKGIIIGCLIEKDESDKYILTSSKIIDEGRYSALDLDDRTMEGYEEIRDEYYEEPDVIKCSECGAIIGYTVEYTDYDGNPLCDKCMVSNSKSDICPTCGRKVLRELMDAGVCVDCAKD